MSKLIILFILIYVTSAISEELSFITGTPSMANIPEIFNAAKYETATTSFDVQSAILFDSVSKYPDLYAYSTFSNLPFVSGRLSMYGFNHYNPESERVDFQFHKFFYSRRIGDNTLGLGIGYDYNETITSEYENNTIVFSDSYNEINKNLTIQDFVTNTIYGNLNGLVPFAGGRKILIGADIYYTRKRGFSLKETYNIYSGNIGLYSTDAVRYYDYGKHAYDYNHSIGFGLQKNHAVKISIKKIISLHLLWTFEKQHSLPKYFEGIQSQFVSRGPDNIQFSGADNVFNKLRLEFIFSEKHPDLINAPHVSLFKLPWCRVSCDWIRFAIVAANEHYRNEIVNKWLRPDGYYWGKTRRDYRKKPLSLFMDHSFRMILFKYFYTNLRHYSDNTFVLYEGESNDAYFHNLHFWFNLGVKFPINNKILFDIKYSPGTITYHSHIEADEEEYTKNYSLFRNPEVQVRFSLLK